MKRLWVALALAAGPGLWATGCETRAGGEPESGEGFAAEYSCGWRAQISCNAVWLREEFRCHSGPCTTEDRSAVAADECVESPLRVTEMLASCDEIAHELNNDRTKVDASH